MDDCGDPWLECNGLPHVLLLVHRIIVVPVVVRPFIVAFQNGASLVPKHLRQKYPSYATVLDLLRNPMTKLFRIFIAEYSFNYSPESDPSRKGEALIFLFEYGNFGRIALYLEKITPKILTYIKLKIE